MYKYRQITKRQDNKKPDIVINMHIIDLKGPDFVSGINGSEMFSIK